MFSWRISLNSLLACGATSFSNFQNNEQDLNSRTHIVDAESNDDFLYPELDPSADEEVTEDSDVFEYEAGFYYDEEDE